VIFGVKKVIRDLKITGRWFKKAFLRPNLKSQGLALRALVAMHEEIAIVMVEDILTE